MYHILYVDDEPALLDLGAIYLGEIKDFTVHIRTSAVDVLNSDNLHSFDAIVSDYQMPGIDGISFLKEVRARSFTIPFILFTGKGREEVVIEAINSGADFYVQKGGDPVSQFAELAHKITIAIQRRRSENQVKTLNRLYQVLSATNKAVIFFHEKEDFFNEICRILVEIGEFRMAWAGFLDENNKIIKPIASFGFIDGYLETITSSSEGLISGDHPIWRAFLENRPIFSNNISTDPDMQQWREEALNRGYYAIASFPFATGTRNAGIISMYAPKSGFFEGQIIELLLEMSKDITYALKAIDDEEEREKAQENLKRQSIRLETASSAGQVALWEWDMKSDTLEWSDIVDSMLGYSSATFPRTIAAWESIIHPDDRTKAMEAIRQHLDLNHRYDEEYRVTRKDGTFVWWRDTGACKRDSAGRPYMMSGACTDITARKSAEIKLEEALYQAHMYLDISGVMIVVLNTEGIITLINKKGCEIFGYPEDALIGKNWFLVCVPERIREDVTRIFHKLMAGESKEVEFYENPVIIKDGSERTIAFHNTVILDTSLKTTGILFSGEDITERKKYETTLKEKNELLFQAQSIAGIGNWKYDILQNSIEWSDEVYRIFGYEPGEINIELDRIRERIHPDDLEMHDKILKSAIDTGNYQKENYRVLLPDGTIKYINADGKAMRNDSGDIVKVIGVVQNITEHKLAVENLFQESIIANANVWLMVIDRKGSVLLWNKAAEKISGYMQSEVLHSNAIWKLLYPDKDIRRGITEKLVKIIQERKYLENFETSINTKCGERKTILWNTKSLEDSPEGPLSYVVIGVDVTKSVLTEKALGDSESKLNAIVRGSPIPQLVIDKHHHVINWNKALEEHSGIRADEVIGTNRQWSAFYPDERPILADLIVDGKVDEIPNWYSGKYEASRLIEGGYEATDFFPHMGTSGIWLHFTAAPIRDSENTVIGAVETLEDITEQKKNEEILRRVNRQLLLLSSITRHDILNKVMVILSYIDLSKDYEIEPLLLDFCEKIKDAANAIRNQIEFTKLFKDFGITEPKWQKLEEILPYNDLPRHVSITSYCGDLEIFADTLFEKVFFNLLDNSLQHGETVTDIKISCRNTDEGLIIIWDDNGKGIPAFEKEKIFERGYGRNTGLGLFLSREVLLNSGITIKETGTPGEGARFEMKVPKDGFRYGPRDGMKTVN